MVNENWRWRPWYRAAQISSIVGRSAGLSLRLASRSAAAVATQIVPRKASLPDNHSCAGCSR